MVEVIKIEMNKAESFPTELNAKETLNFLLMFFLATTLEITLALLLSLTSNEEFIKVIGFLLKNHKVMTMVKSDKKTNGMIMVINILNQLKVVAAIGMVQKIDKILNKPS